MMSTTIKNYCIDCKSVAQLDCDARGHIVGTLGQSDSKASSQLNPTGTASEETQELQRDASKLAYTAIRFSGLYRELTGEEWDALADKLGALAVGLIQDESDAELTRRETENREMDQWLSR